MGIFVPLIATGMNFCGYQEFIINMFGYEFMQNALIISLMIAFLCPFIGIFLVLRRYSMIGDTLAHASLAGISIGLLLKQNPILGAFFFTAIAGALIEFLHSYFKKYADLILTIILSLSVGIAITIISSGRLRVNADAFLFGSVLTVTKYDMLTVLILSIASVSTALFLYHQLLYIAFDEEAARLAKVKVKLINYAFSILVAATISISIRIVGVLVLSSLIAIPVATAMQLGKGFKETLLFAILFSFIDIIGGLIFSYYLNVATGGFTALVSVLVLFIVMLAKRIGFLRSLKQSRAS
ncbi:MAG: metal ABC transporter permease [Anaerolineaceae bacterium]|nr:metal ABC transporter permease [Anaerolineaceae bacterium]